MNFKYGNWKWDPLFRYFPPIDSFPKKIKTSYPFQAYCGLIKECFKIYNIYFKISVQIFILTEETSSLSFARKLKSIIETEAISSLKICQLFLGGNLHFILKSSQKHLGNIIENE